MSSKLQIDDFYYYYADKTELIRFGSAAHLEHLQAESVGLTIASVNVEAVDCVRDLGVYLDSRLDLHAHIGRVVSTCYFHLRRLRHLRHTVSQEVRQHLVSALILSRIDYCNVPDVTLAPQSQVMNAAVRFAAGLDPRAHLTAAWRDLQRITYKL